MKKQLLSITLTLIAVTAHAGTKPSTPDEALKELNAGNERFRTGTMLKRDLLAEMKSTSRQQKPFAAVLSCIDSRTSSELIFDQGIGDIFNARLAGNVADPDVTGSLEFATKVAGAKLIAVIGHTKCGAVSGSVDKVKLGHLTGLLERITPAVETAARECQNEERTSKNTAFVDKCAEENVRLQVRELAKNSTILRELVEAGQLRVVGGIYDLETGRVRFLGE